MKLLALISLLFVASCASRSKPQIIVRPWSPPAVEPVEAVRYPEVTRAYQVGRYVDPNHPDLMHEQHPLYRVETHSRWNLQPGALCLPGVIPLNLPPTIAYSPALTNDVILAELSRQKDATEPVMGQAAAQNQVVIGARIAEAERRVTELEKEAQCAIHNATNRVPAFATEQTGAPEP